jgi:hypothetical protein
MVLNSKIILIIHFIVKGVPPSPRAAHSSTNVEQMQMVVYGGATGGIKIYEINNLIRWKFSF